ncbi:MAG: hypothetical protein A2096_13955 [Spirochaetes bacterium GWF1_41_5]|nr:MAG: hypothetical protein A2096_13955 [Spirochaetes bacterium GWF1_41_5]
MKNNRSVFQITAFHRPDQACDTDITPFFLRASIVRAEKISGFPSHIHREYEIIFAARKEYSCLINNREYNLVPDDLLIVCPEDTHEDICPAGAEFFSIAFKLQCPGLKNSINFLMPDNEKNRVLRSCHIFRNIFSGIISKSQSRSPAAGYLLDSLLRTFFWTLICELPEQALDENFKDIVYRTSFKSKVFSMFRSHLFSSLSLTAMGEIFGLSSRAFSGKCSEILGESPSRAFNRYKLEYACHLLADTEMSINEISSRLAFANQYHFSRTFRKFYNKTPGSIRADKTGD